LLLSLSEEGRSDYQFLISVDTLHQTFPQLFLPLFKEVQYVLTIAPQESHSVSCCRSHVDGPPGLAFDSWVLQALPLANCLPVGPVDEFSGALPLRMI
jgi:hypothetical protein